MRGILAVAICVVLVGCVGPLVPVTKVDETTAASLRSKMQIYRDGDQPPVSKPLGPLMATSCKNKMWDPPATEENAADQMRVAAVNKGADAIGNFSCVKQEYSSVATNCWESVACTGTALQTIVQQQPNGHRRR